MKINGGPLLVAQTSRQCIGGKTVRAKHRKRSLLLSTSPICKKCAFLIPRTIVLLCSSCVFGQDGKESEVCLQDDTENTTEAHQAGQSRHVDCLRNCVQMLLVVAIAGGIPILVMLVVILAL